MKKHIKPFSLTQYIIKPTNLMGVIRDVLTAIGVSAGHAAVWPVWPVRPVWPSFSLSANSFVMLPWLSTAFIITLSTLLLVYLTRNTDRGETAELLRHPITTQLNSNYAEAPRIFKSNRPWELDITKMVARSTFMVKPVALILRCKEVLRFKVGVDREEDLAADFVYSSPVLALGKEKYLEYMRSVVNVDDRFSSYNPGYCGYQVCPFNPNRVWFYSFWSGKHTDMPQNVPFPVAEAADIDLDASAVPDATRVLCPPTVCSLTFDDAGLVIAYTDSYVIDRTLGTTGGLGGAFGALFGIRDSPFAAYPEGNPPRRSVKFKLGSFLYNATHAAKKRAEESLEAVPVE